MQQVTQEIIQEIEKRKISTEKELNKLTSEISSKYKLKTSPKKIHLLLHATESQREKLSKLLITKPIRTLSGVAPVALFSAPTSCPPQAQCIFCPGGPGSIFGNVPKSYTGNEPASRRAARNNYDPYLQIFNRLEHYTLINQDFDKVEIIIMGGTFTFLPERYKNNFITQVYRAMNDFSDLFLKNKKLDFEKFKDFFELPTNDFKDPKRVERIHKKLLELKDKNSQDLEQEKLRNETSNIKCVSLLIETRPDCGKLKEGNEILSYGGTKVELGIQSVYDEDLEFVKRGHSVKDSIESIRILKDLGFKLSYHYMLGLCEDRKKDLEGLKSLFSNPDFKPDMLKIYPCLVMPGTPLHELWKEGKYNPITIDDSVEIISEAKRIFPKYLRVQRIQRDIPSTVIASGPIRTNLRQDVQAKCFQKNIQCQCIRCREPMNKDIDWKSVKLLTLQYEASQGHEFFISFEDTKNNLILGFSRLRFPSQFLRKEITENSAIIRELHIYGPAVKIGDSGKVQHKGLGKKLIEEAERISLKNNKDKMLIIAGVGVRKYFIDKLNYKKDGPYVSKSLSNKIITN